MLQDNLFLCVRHWSETIVFYVRISLDKMCFFIQVEQTNIITSKPDKIL